LLEERLTHSIIGSFYEVHRELGFGYREHIYALALERDLVAKGHQVDREVAVMVYYRGEPLARQTLDRIVDQRVIVETKVRDVLRQPDSDSSSATCAQRTSKLASSSIFTRVPTSYRVICENRLKCRSEK
jgi:GxxExxY protein